MKIYEVLVFGIEKNYGITDDSCNTSDGWYQNKSNALKVAKVKMKELGGSFIKSTRKNDPKLNHEYWTQWKSDQYIVSIWMNKIKDLN